MESVGGNAKIRGSLCSLFYCFCREIQDRQWCKNCEGCDSKISLTANAELIRKKCDREEYRDFKISSRIRNNKLLGTLTPLLISEHPNTTQCKENH